MILVRQNLRIGFVAGFLLVIWSQAAASQEEEDDGIEAPVSELDSFPDEEEIDPVIDIEQTEVLEEPDVEYDVALDDDEITGENFAIRVEEILEPPSDYQYAAFGRPDPFVPPLKIFSANFEIPIVSPLQRYDLSELLVIGVWELDSGDRKALIMTPKQEGIITQVGDPVGRRGGKVIEIMPNDVIIREFTLSLDGTRQFDDISLSLPRGELPETDLLLGIEGASGANRRAAPGFTESQSLEFQNEVNSDRQREAWKGIDRGQKREEVGIGALDQQGQGEVGSIRSAFGSATGEGNP